MQAYYEIETDIPPDHQLSIRLPDNIPAGRAKVAVIYQVYETGGNQTQMAAFLNALPDNPTTGLDRDQIQAFVSEERGNWDD
jgi:hypothetical protein